MSITLETRYDSYLPQLQQLTLVWKLDDDELFDTDERDFETLDGVELGRLEAWRYNDPFFDPFDVSDILVDLDDRSVDLGAIAGDLADHEEALRSALEDEIDVLHALLVGYRLNVPPYLRGRRIGLEMMKALQTYHAGVPCLYALHAVPMEANRNEPSYPALQRRLAAYYLSEPRLRLKQVCPKNAPTFLVAHWPGETFAQPDLDFDYAELANAVRAARPISTATAQVLGASA